MQIQLKQAEIVSALKQYLTGKGIDLVNKTFAVSFTAGRRDAGLSADIAIEEIVVPNTAFEETPKPALKVVKAVLTPESDPDPEVATTPGAKSLFGS